MRRLKWFEIMICIVVQISVQIGVNNIWDDIWLSMGVALISYYLTRFLILKSVP